MNPLAEIAIKPRVSEPPAKAEALLLDFAGAAALLGIGRTLLYEMHVDGRLGPLPVRFGRRVLFRSAELREWVECGCEPRQRWLSMKGASR